MKKWFLEHKKQVILSMIGTFLPTIIGLILWNQLPDTMTSHWGADGVADGTAGKGFMVFGFPAIMAAVNLLCMIGTVLDKKNQNHNKKLMGIIFWIMPLISVTVISSAYAIALGNTIGATMAIPLLMGILLVAIGNYMPKATQNRTMGIKIYWTLANEDNWNKTHRFAGKLWVVGGVLVLLGMLLPLKWMVMVLVPVMLLMIILPILYSYSIYRKHRMQGIEYPKNIFSKGEKKATKASAALVAVILVGVGFLMFTGDINYTCGADALQIEANFQSDITVPYEAIEKIELRDDFRVGTRVMGYGSAKLSMGNFRNDELGLYTLYSYNNCDSMILIYSNGKYLAINSKTPEETEALYLAMLEKIS